MAQTRREREKGMEKENLVPAEFTNNQDGRMTKGPATIVGAEQGDAFRIVTGAWAFHAVQAAVSCSIPVAMGRRPIKIPCCTCPPMT
jgi:hypothetical protein